MPIKQSDSNSLQLVIGELPMWVGIYRRPPASRLLLYNGGRRQDALHYF